MQKQVSKFIEEFLDFYWEWCEKFFLNGWCKIFSDILLRKFKGKQLRVLWHYITKIDWKYWDITWELDWVEETLKHFPGDKSDRMDKYMNSYQNIIELLK